MKIVNPNNSHADYTRRCDLPSLTDIQGEIESLMSSWYSDDIKLNFSVLSIIETLANIFEHSFNSNNQIEQYVYITITKRSRLVTTLVVDNGDAIPQSVQRTLTSGLSQMPNLDVCTTELPDSGWGLNLILHSTKSVSYERKGNTNYLELVFDSDIDT